MYTREEGSAPVSLVSLMQLNIDSVSESSSSRCPYAISHGATYCKQVSGCEYIYARAT